MSKYQFTSHECSSAMPFQQFGCSFSTKHCPPATTVLCLALMWCTLCFSCNFCQVMKLVCARFVQKQRTPRLQNLPFLTTTTFFFCASSLLSRSIASFTSWSILSEQDSKYFSRSKQKPYHPKRIIQVSFEFFYSVRLYGRTWYQTTVSLIWVLMWPNCTALEIRKSKSNDSWTILIQWVKINHLMFGGDFNAPCSPFQIFIFPLSYFRMNLHTTRYVELADKLNYVFSGGNWHLSVFSNGSHDAWCKNICSSVVRV